MLDNISNVPVAFNTFSITIIDNHLTSRKYFQRNCPMNHSKIHIMPYIDWEGSKDRRLEVIETLVKPKMYRHYTIVYDIRTSQTKLVFILVLFNSGKNATRNSAHRQIWQILLLIPDTTNRTRNSGLWKISGRTLTGKTKTETLVEICSLRILLSINNMLQKTLTLKI